MKYILCKGVDSRGAECIFECTVKYSLFISQVCSIYAMHNAQIIDFKLIIEHTPRDNYDGWSFKNCDWEELGNVLDSVNGCI